MTSTFTWLDYSEAERRKMLDVIGLFGEKTIRDESEIGGVRDAFDVACMLASMGGLGNPPRFLLDDSPRHADLESPMYQQLLQSNADLELLSGRDVPAFQYILTTTTRPNKNLAKDPYLCLTLDSITDENILLGVRF